MSVLDTWVENNVAYYALSGPDGTNVFEVEEALNKTVQQYDFPPLRVMDILEFSEYVYVTQETLEKESWPKDEVFETIHDAPNLIPVGTIDLEAVWV